MNITNLKKNPFDLGDYLLNEFNGLSHTEVANIIELDRHAVRNYRRIGSWSLRVRSFVEENNIRTTPLIKAAQKSDLYNNEEALLEYLAQYNPQSIKQKTPARSKGVKSMGNLTKIENEFSLQKEIEELKEIIIVQEKKIEELKTFKSIHKETKNPFNIIHKFFEKIFYTVFVIGLTIFLVSQNYDFLTTKTSNLTTINFLSWLPSLSLDLKSLGQSLAIESVLILSAVAMLRTKGIIKVLSGLLLSIAILGTGVFMKVNIENNTISENSTVKALEMQRDLLEKNIISYQTTLSGYNPETHPTKRNELNAKISLENDKLTAINNKIEVVEVTAIGNERATIWSDAAIRVCVMLTSVLALHLLLFSHKTHSLK